MNSVKLYSNGTAVISRQYPFADREPLRITIPVRKRDLDDVISSLTVFGNVTITEPPTYTPTNAQEPTLTLNSGNVLLDLATKLAGAEVTIDAGTTYRGRLVGVHEVSDVVRDFAVMRKFLVVLTDEGLKQVDLSAVSALQFTEAVVQAELDKALRASLSKLNPESSLVELTIQANAQDAQAVVTYATPVAAWKIRYQLRLDSQTNETRLIGQAVVDNDTDDDWTETAITVITGEPITFSTDLAEIRRPARSRLNLVSDRAIGAVNASPVIPQAPMSSPKEMLRSIGYYGDETIRCAPASCPDPDTDYELDMEMESEGAQSLAQQSQADVRESGDFSVFTSPDRVSVGAKKSAIIPLFQTDIGESQKLLLYKESDDAQRPFRAVRFRNGASHTLGRGLCEITIDGDFQGKSVLEPAKPDEEVTLIHAKETGVRIFKTARFPEVKRIAVRVSENSGVCESLRKNRTSYRIINSHAAAFTLEIEHLRALDESSIECRVSSGEMEIKDIPNGQRIGVKLEPKGVLMLEVTESRVMESSYNLDVPWLKNYVLTINAAQSKIKGILQCVDLQEKADALEAQIRIHENTVKVLGKEQDRLMKLIPNGLGEQANAWRADLGKTEKEIRELTRVTIPGLSKQAEERKKALNQALANLAFAWSEEETGVTG